VTLAPQTTRRALLALAATILVCVLAVPAALGQSGSPAPAQTASGPAYLTGISDQQTELFTSPLWEQLRTKIVRYAAPYDAAVRSDELAKAREWIHDAEADHQQVLIAFYHSDHTPTVMPSVATYQKDVAKFIADFPRVHQYETWDESNRGNVKHVFSSPSGSAVAKYYQALRHVCHGCTIVGLDVLDAQVITPTLRYIAEFKREIGRLHTPMPSIWGLHNYSDINRLQSWRTSELVKALGGQVWLTETGGLVRFPPDFLNVHGSGIARAAKVLKFMFEVAAAHKNIKRLYIYDWTGGTASTTFDAGLVNAHGEPRPGYVVVCKQLHAAHCNVKTVDN
jgi:hypothetical protein